MKKLSILVLKGLRRLFGKTRYNELHKEYFKGLSWDPQETADRIKKLLNADAPCTIARYGATELSCITNCMSIKHHRHELMKYLRGEITEWWWNESIMQQMQEWSGFFPPTKENLMRFTDLMMEDTRMLDVLVSWQHGEIEVKDYFPKDIERIKLILFDPFWAENPWTEVLEEKKVLVVHPFAKQIERIYKSKREKLFKNPKILPEFDLKVIPAVQSLGGDCNNFTTWFEAFDWMKAEMDKVDYDIALIGCGAYGFPLAAHAKRTGHKGVHMAGSLQLLFGIKGKRWEDPNYGATTLHRKGAYPELFNEYWEYPDDIFKPKNADKVEGSCYWK